MKLRLAFALRTGACQRIIQNQSKVSEPDHGCLSEAQEAESTHECHRQARCQTLFPTKITEAGQSLI